MIDALKLTTYFGERDRVDGGFLADALTGLYARHELQASVVLRGIEGFGAKHHLRTDRLLTLSEDLPIVSVAVDARPRIEAVLAEVEALHGAGLVTLARAQMLTAPLAEPGPDLPAVTKLTVHLGRGERAGDRLAYEAVVALLHDRGIAGATVLLGVDGTAHGVRERAGFLATNAAVPVMVIAVGDGARIAAVLPELGTLLPRPLVTVERVDLCKRDGRLLAAPPASDAPRDKLVVYAGEQSQHRGRPLHHQLVRRLREAGAAGVTSVRGVHGYHGDHAPHGDRLLQLRRRVPVLTVVIDTPPRCREWFAIADELTDETGLVTIQQLA